MKFEGKLKTKLLMITAATLLSTANVYADSTKDIDQRLQPVGQVNVADATPAATTTAAPTAATATPASATKLTPHEKAEKTYGSYCTVCHKDGVAGAPKFGTADWTPRLAATKETDKNKQLDVLLASALKGKGAMPPHGTCPTIDKDPVNGCSDADLKATIQYMISGGKEPAADKK